MKAEQRSNKAIVDGRLHPGVQFTAIVYDNKVKQCGATLEIRWKFMTSCNLLQRPAWR